MRNLWHYVRQSILVTVLAHGILLLLPKQAEAQSCEGNCGEYVQGVCGCDEACWTYGDCCSDICTECSFLGPEWLANCGGGCDSIPCSTCVAVPNACVTDQVAYENVIAILPSCCDSNWDSSCQNYYDYFSSTCTDACSSVPCVGCIGVPDGCVSDQTAYNIVITNNPSCCELSWDSTCQDAYDAISSSCAEEYEACGSVPCPNCVAVPDCVTNQIAYNFVIANNPNCCSDNWDTACQEAYNEFVFNGYEDFGDGCQNSAVIPLEAIYAPTTGGAELISNQTTEETFSIILSVAQGQVYEFTSDGNSWITIHFGFSGGTVVAEGYSPLSVLAYWPGDFYVSWNSDENCGTSDESITTTMECITCDPPCVAGWYQLGGVCELCPPGFYCPGNGFSYSCPAGEFSCTNGAVSCESCPDGYYSDPGSVICELCDADTGLEACAADCNGVFGGTAYLDDCATCVGGDTGLEACVQDCNGDYGGTAYLDNCATCVGGNTGEVACVQDCNGDYGGSAYLDNCATCVGGNTGLEACATDCNGVYGGTAYLDDCATCVGGDTGLDACVQDCNGDWGGTAYLDNCTTCVGGNTGLEACATDCNGVFGGTAYLDDCGDCVGGSTGEEPCELCDLALSYSVVAANPGTPDGEATVIAVGGDEPYVYAWNDPLLQNTATASGLFAGTYVVTVTDAGDCAEQLTVVVPVVSGVASTKVASTFCNTSGYGLSDFVSADAVAGAEAYRWEFTDSQNNTLPEYTRADGNKWVRLAWITDIELGETYNVRVKARVSGVWGEYADVCSIGVSQLVPTTEVIPSHSPSNAQGNPYSLCDITIAYNIANAENFRWRFDPDVQTSGDELIYTRGAGNPSVRLSWVPGLEPGTIYQVDVQVQVDGSWSDYGVQKPIELAAVPNNLAIRPQYCGGTYGPNSVILSESICEADYYRFRLVPAGGGAPVYRTSGNYVLLLNGSLANLAPGDYNLDVMVSQGGQPGDFGPDCLITIGGPSAPDAGGIALQRDITEQGSASLYPNPSSGKEVRIMLTGLAAGNHDVIVTVYDLYGKQLNMQNFAHEGDALNRLVRFDQKLARGVYMVQIVINGEIHTIERMVVH